MSPSSPLYNYLYGFIPMASSLWVSVSRSVKWKSNTFLTEDWDNEQYTLFAALGTQKEFNDYIPPLSPNKIPQYRIRRPRFESWFCQLLTEEDRSLMLSFLNCKISSVAPWGLSDKPWNDVREHPSHTVNSSAMNEMNHSSSDIQSLEWDNLYISISECLTHRWCSINVSYFNLIIRVAFN